MSDSASEDGGSIPPAATIPDRREHSNGREDDRQTTATGFSSLDFTGITTAITSVITPGDIVTLMATVIAAGLLFSLAWWGGRMIVNSVMISIKTGRLTIATGGYRRR